MQTHVPILERGTTQHHFPSTWGSAQPHKAEEAAREAPSASALEKQPQNQGSGRVGVVTCCLQMSRVLGANVVSAGPQRDFAPFVPLGPHAALCFPFGGWNPAWPSSPPLPPLPACSVSPALSLLA